ncbi:MAG: DUF1631 family protein, partial [Pseudomonadota bacterium]
MSPSKVVSLHGERTQAAALPARVDGLRRDAEKQLQTLLSGLLDSTDDALFEMADRSHSDADHNLYFDAMRRIRLHRSDLERRFVDEVRHGFHQAFAAAGGAVMESAHVDDMTLVDNDELEISVAISGIVSKITSQHSLGIMALTRRFAGVARDPDMTERRNPLGPQM